MMCTLIPTYKQEFKPHIIRNCKKIDAKYL